MEILNVEYSDSLAIKKMLSKSKAIVNYAKLLPEILEHIDKPDCVAMKLVDGEKLLGVWLSREFEKHTSLSYFFIDEEVRKHRIVLEFFGKCIINISPTKPIIITSNDITGFERYVEKINDNQYVFKGFR